MQTPPADRAGVLAPPPLIFLGFLLVALAFHFSCCPWETGLPMALRRGLAALLGGAALTLLAGASQRFRRAGTQMRPWLPTTAIVTEGPYQWTRNPMYLGMTVLYSALALVADSMLALVFVPALLVVIQFGVVAREERYLEAKFGESYLVYKNRVRRWF